MLIISIIKVSICSSSFTVDGGSTPSGLGMRQESRESLSSDHSSTRDDSDNQWLSQVGCLKTYFTDHSLIQDIPDNQWLSQVGCLKLILLSTALFGTSLVLTGRLPKMYFTDHSIIRDYPDHQWLSQVGCLKCISQTTALFATRTTSGSHW